MNTAHHACSPCRLNAIYFYFRIQCFQGKSHATYQSASAHRHYYSIKVWYLVYQFKTDSSLSCYYVLVVKRMNKRIAFLFLQGKSLVVGIIIHAWHKTNVCTVSLCGLYLAYRGTLGQTYQRLYTVGRCTKGYTLRMVSCRTCYNTVSLFVIAQLRYLVARATHFKRSCTLQTFQFKINLTFWVYHWCMNDFCLSYHLAQFITGFVEII